MTHRYHSSNFTVHQSTGLHKFTQQIRSQKGSSVAAPGAPGGLAGHRTAEFRNTVQSVVVNAAGGTFKLTLQGNQTAALAYNASPATVENALIAAWPNAYVGEQSLEVRGTAGNYTIELKGQFKNENVPAMTADASSLTGGSHSVTISIIQAGNGDQTNPANGVNDDPMYTELTAQDSIAIGNICGEADSLVGGQIHVSGEIVVPQPPPGSEEPTEPLWRGHTFSSRIPNLNNA